MSYIQTLIEQGEHQRLDFKFAVNDSKKIARTLSAFANTDGGRLLLGVKDNGKIAGVRSEEEYHMIEAASQLYTKPSVLFQSKQHNVQGKIVLEITVRKSSILPVLAPDLKGKMKAFIRIHDQNRLANGIQIKVWQQKNKNKGIKIVYTDAEEFILKYLIKNETITLSKFRKLANIPFRKAEKILVDFIILDIIEIVFTPTIIYYKLKKKD